MTLNLNKHHKQWMVFLLVVVTIAIISILLHFKNMTVNELSSMLVEDDIKIFTPDWGVGATLVMMEHPPVAIGDKRIYPTWVDDPKLPKDIIDIGTRSQPNLELLAQLQPDLILDTFFYKESRNLYDPGIPVYDIDFGIKNNRSVDKIQWATFVLAANKIGVLLNKPAQAEKYLIDSKQRINEAGETIRQKIGKDKKIVVANFWDARELSFYTTNSHVYLAAQMMRLDMLSIGNGGQWGSVTVPMHRLYELPDNVCLIIAEPLPDTIKYEIAHSPIWQRSPFFKPDACIYKIDPVWTNGGIEVLVNFAENLAEAVTSPTQNEFSFEYVTQMEGGQ